MKGDNMKYYDKKIESYKKRVRWLRKIMMEQIQMINLYKECKDCLINEIFNKGKGEQQTLPSCDTVAKHPFGCSKGDEQPKKLSSIEAWREIITGTPEGSQA